jgi:hypothetical protein
VLYSDFEEVFVLILQYVSTLTAGRLANAIAHQRNIFEIQIPVGVLFRPVIF